MSINTNRWTVLDTEGRLLAESGLLQCLGGKATAAAGDPGLALTTGIAHSVGLTLVAQLNHSVQTSNNWVGFNDDTSPGAAAVAGTLYGLANIAGALRVYLAGTQKGGNTLMALVADTDYVFKIAMGLSGASYWYFSTDAGVTWRLFWVQKSGGSTATLYPAYSNLANAWTSDYIRVWRRFVPQAVIDAVAAAPTPTYGSELMTNGSMETGDPPSSWSVLNAATLDGVADERTGGAGIQSMDIVRGTGPEGAGQAKTLTAHAWYLLDGWMKKGTADVDAKVTAYSTLYLLSLSVTAAVWTEAKGSFRANQAAVSVYLEVASGVGQTSRFDDVSLKQITLSSALSGGGDAGSKYGVFDAAVTVADLYQAGELACLDDADTPANYLHAYVDRALNKAFLLKVVAGTTTELTSGSITYGAAKKVRTVSIPGTSGLSNAQVSLYYGTADSEAQVGTTQTVDLSSGYGTLFRAFDTSGAATLDMEANV